MAAVALNSPSGYPESPMDQEDVVYPCKGCGEILEEGKAFELAGNRWHIDCFRCNTCNTLLDSDANLLLLGDGSLICNNCTYSCSACGNKIEDLAILTGDQAFCSGCFRCRNCKRKIENLRYARTSQGIFCMSCHESLMARRRKKGRTPKDKGPPGPGAEKALPSLPPTAAHQHAFTPDAENPPDLLLDSHGTPEPSKSPHDRHTASRNGDIVPSAINRDASPLSDEPRRDGPTLPASIYNDGRSSNLAGSVDANEDDEDDADADDDGSERGFLPMAFDPTPVSGPSQLGLQPPVPRKQISRAQDSSLPVLKETSASSKDYFGANGRPGTKQDKQWAASESSGSGSVEREADRQPKPSPHILYQEKGRKTKRETSGASTPASGPSNDSPVMGNHPEKGTPKSTGLPIALDPHAQNQQDSFKLQDVPSTAKVRSRANSKVNSHKSSPVEDVKVESKIALSRSPASLASQNSDVNPFDDPKRKKGTSQGGETPLPAKHVDRMLPLRGDSLNAAAARSKSPTPDFGATATSSTKSSTPDNLQAPHLAHTRNQSGSSVPSSSLTDATRTLSSRETNHSSVLDQPQARSGIDALPPPRSVNRPSAPSKSVANDDFIAPRHAPPPPPQAGHRSHESVSGLQSNHSEALQSIDGRTSPAIRSAGLPKYSLDGGFSMDDEMGRILRGEESSASPGSVLRKVSHAVKHGRSFSDRTGAGVKPSRHGSVDVSSSHTPQITSPTSADGLDALRSSLRRAQLHIAELQAEKLGLQEKLEGSTDIKAVNTELREKRSTMAFLDTQREMVVRELEIMTEHLTQAKDNNQPLNLGSLKTSILQDFANSLQRLKEDLGGQVEELIRMRQALTDEITSLIQMKDKGFQEYESLSSKNTQLLQHNNELIRSIQGIYQDNRSPNALPIANGLGIFQPTGKTDSTVGATELRNLNVMSTDPTMPNVLQDPADTGVLAAPQVVNIRKGGKPNKFNWRRGGEKITGKVTKGIKGAFVGTENRQPTGQYSIGLPYNQTQHATGGSEQSSLTSKTTDDNKAASALGSGYGFFGPKSAGLKQGDQSKNSSNPSLVTAEPPSVLFGSELVARCEHENRLIPSIAMQCISEVESRGMDVEGIYRKSGGAGQVKTIQQGFEKDDNFDVSDPELDIHAVTSALKQYFRKLPTPLIVYDAYDSLLEAGKTQESEKQIAALRIAVSELPEAHRDCLQFLVQHLARVMEQEAENLMTPFNLAVVFAPTIMRPLSIEREMSDMQAQRHAVQAMLENHTEVFGADD